jgi:hypothetical protein
MKLKTSIHTLKLRVSNVSQYLTVCIQLITYLITYYTEQSPYWEANRFAASQAIYRTVRNLKVHYHIQKCQLPVPILSQLDPVRAPTSGFILNS